MLNPQTPARRADDSFVPVLTQRIDTLCEDISDMKKGMNRLADAMTKLAVVEERQTQTILAQERAFKALERVEAHQRQHEAACREQEKELRELIAAGDKEISDRVATLEQSEPLQKQTSGWMLTGIGVLITVVATAAATKLVGG